MFENHCSRGSQKQIVNKWQEGEVDFLSWEPGWFSESQGTQESVSQFFEFTKFVSLPKLF